MAKTIRTLTKAEEEIMQILWRLEKAFVKDVIDELPEPKPHYNTVSTIIKILSDKGFVGYESFGKSNRYFPLVAREDYSKSSFNQLLQKYFNGSFASMLSFFVKEKDLSIEQMEDILKEIKKNSENQTRG